MRASTLALVVAALALAPSAARAQDDRPPPPDEAPPPPLDPAANKLVLPKLPPLNLPPDTEQADSGDSIGFVNVRFGVVAQGLQDFTTDNSDDPNTLKDLKTDTQLKILQLRAFGQLP